MRVWFNHWFSAVYHIISMMREGEPEHTYIGSSENAYAVYKEVCDEFYVEPGGLDENAYVDYLTAIALCKSRFEAAGVKLLANTDGELAKTLDDKRATYEAVQKILPEVVPEYYVAESYGAFVAHCETLRGKGYRVCYKLTVDEGARSFRVLDERIESGNAVYEKPGSKLTFAAAQKVMKEYSFAKPVLIMPYLDGVEISADCLQTDKGKLIIPRYKMNKRYSEVCFDEGVTALCERLLEGLGCEMPVNIQFKMREGKPYLLEINPRMSGGLQLSCKASAINLPALALKKLLGKPHDWRYPEKRSAKVVHIETPVCLD